MFTEVLKLVTKIDTKDLDKMFKSLNSRFASAAKKFGGALSTAFKFTGLIAVVGSIVGKLLNPLEKAEELFNKITGKGDDAVTNAEEFGSDPGKLLRLEALAASKGLDAQTLRQLLGKFQGALATEQEAAALPGRLREKLAVETDPVQKKILQAQLQAAQVEANKRGRLHEFIGETDMADAFFSFVQALQALDPSERTVVQNEIFGEKIRGKASEFFNAKDFSEILKSLPSVEQLRDAATRSGKVSDLNDLLRARRESEIYVRQSFLVSEKQAYGFDRSARQSSLHEDESLKRFDSLKDTSIAIQELTHKFDTFATKVMTDTLPKLVDAINAITKFVQEDVSPRLETLMAVAKDVTEKAIPKIESGIAWARETWAEFKNSPFYKYWSK